MIDGVLTATTPFNLLMVVLGCLSGTLIGMLPGLGPATAVALMIPATYALDPASALIMLAGVYYGAVFGGSTSSILINAPGCASTLATTFDGFPLARSGRAGTALALAAYSSFTGGTIGALALLVAAPLLAQLALGFQSPDYFLLMVLALVGVSALSDSGRVLAGYAMAVLGLMLATVGTDGISGMPRLTFGRLDLIDGFDFLLLAMATFALAEIFISILRGEEQQVAEPAADVGSLKLTQSEVRDVAVPVVRSSVLGFLVGVLPGAGATIASLLAYGSERSLAPAREQARFGLGSLRGLAAPESANNAASTGSFVPLLTLGIPGSGTTAILLGALIAYGIQPGPRLFVDHPALFWSVIVSMYIGNVVLLFINLPLIPYLARILRVERRVLFPMVVLFCLIGVYLVSFNAVDIIIMVLIGVLAVALRLAGFPLAPLLLGFIVGGYLEENLQRSLILYDGSWSFLWTRTSSLLLCAGILLLAALPAIRSWGVAQVGR